MRRHARPLLQAHVRDADSGVAYTARHRLCQHALQDFGAPSDASTDDFRTWLGSYMDKTASANKWVMHVTVVLLKQWHALKQQQ